ncbi:hypothetical protein T4D_16005 [Trichinella pseudospiralis]|uniref:Uncharacterized protein n=1 Tax=Trichinella pseudospiralis TaxID=6337 RepID=A0A0V1DT92_TRIPS|nr:hypothetical protein T4D_5670 [Trichinella pseudospiralis]KRY64673.1 hypothetical protein T4D_16005 [Trichinella pseudospiralis]
MNRNTHEEERRKVEEAFSIAIMDRLDRIALWRRHDLLKSSVKASSLQRHNE